MKKIVQHPAIYTINLFLDIGAVKAVLVLLVST